MMLNPELAATILESVRRGTPPRQAAIAAGISDKTLERWRKVAAGHEPWPDSQVTQDSRERITAFIAELSKAQAECMTVLTNSLYENATTRNEKTGWFDTQAADKILSKGALRDEWFERKHSTVDSVITHRVEDQLANGATLEQLEAWSELPELPSAPTD